MQITVAEPPAIRRMEAVSFRSFPATITHFNGSWAIRLTKNHPAKRLNSINPLDPEDHMNIGQRLQQEVRRFSKFGRPLIVRTTPLTSDNIIGYLDRQEWEYFDESVIMILDLQNIKLEDASPQLPFRNTEYWLHSFYQMEGHYKVFKFGMFDIINATHAKTALFLRQNNNLHPLSALRAVLDDDRIGLFDIVTSAANQRQGLATSLLYSALIWARQQSASQAWLQVVTSNHPAIFLYKSLGFQEFYHYAYRRPRA